MDLAVLQGCKHRTPRFMLVTAIAELTGSHERCEFREIGIDLFRFGIPQGKRLPSRGIGQIAAAFKLE